MAQQANILRISALMAFVIFFISQAKGQEIYYSDGKEQFKTVKEGMIDASTNDLTLGWTSENRFRGPWIVVMRKNGVRMDSVVTRLSAYEIDLSKTGDVDVEVWSGDKQMRMDVSVNHPWDFSWMVIPILIIGMLAMSVYTIRVWLRRRRELAERMLDTPAPRRAKKYDSATVLFSDIQGFTKIAEHTDPEQLVDELDKYFIYFDELVERYNVEKIKTIGDAYMCAGGVPDMDSANPIEVALVGLGMIDYVKERRTRAGGFWNMRVGIHTGPVVSAALGYKKKVFDIWGDSVNTASRMESSGVPGEVNVSGDTYNLISDYFECEHRGRMPVKYKGEIDMYFIKRLKPEYSEGGSFCRPNKALIQRIQAMKVDDILFEFSERLKDSELMEFYGRLEMLMMHCETLCYAEGMTVRDTMVAKLLLAYGFSHNECSRDMRIELQEVMRRLKNMHFDDEEIEEIHRLLSRATSVHKPETHVESVVSDSYNLMYGRLDLAKQLKLMYICASTSGRRFHKKDWIKHQQKTLAELSYDTSSARELAEVPIEKQKEVLEQIIRQL